MRTLCRKSLLLFGAVLAVCAFVGPSMSSAASWAPLGATFAGTYEDFSWTQTVPVHLGMSCEHVEFDIDIDLPLVITVTSASWKNCSGSFSATGCTATTTGTGFPWKMTAPSTTNIQIHSVRMDVRFETRPPAGSTACALNGVAETLTGTLTGGSWDPSATGTNRRVTFRSDPGLTSHSALGSSPVLVSGSMRSPAGTMNLFD